MAIDPFPEPCAGSQTPRLRHQRSRAFPKAVREREEGSSDTSTEWAGSNLVPSNGYSSLVRIIINHGKRTARIGVDEKDSVRRMARGAAGMSVGDTDV